MHTGRLPRSWPLNTNEEIQQTHSTENILPHGYWRISMLWHPSEASHLLHVKQESDLPFRKRTRSDVQSATAPRLSVRASIVKKYRMELPETTSKLGPCWCSTVNTRGSLFLFLRIRAFEFMTTNLSGSYQRTSQIVPWLVSLQLEDLFQDLFRR